MESSVGVYPILPRKLAREVLMEREMLSQLHTVDRDRVEVLRTGMGATEDHASARSGVREDLPPFFDKRLRIMTGHPVLVIEQYELGHALV